MNNFMDETVPPPKKHLFVLPEIEGQNLLNKKNIKENKTFSSPNFFYV